MIWREAEPQDVVALLRDDILGKGRVLVDLSRYEAAFRAMQA